MKDRLFYCKKYKFIKPSIIETEYLVGYAYDNCGNRYFHRFVYRCVYDIKFENVTIIKEGILHVSLGYREFVTEYD